MNLGNLEKEWVNKHFGHTLKVHEIYYEQASAQIETSHIAKILLLQDHDQIKNFARQKLQDIDLTDIVFGGSPSSTSTEEGRTLDSLIAKKQGHEEMEALDLQDDLFADVGREEILKNKRSTTKARKCLETRQKWTLEEEAASWLKLRHYLKSILSVK